MLKPILFLLAFSLFLVSGNAFLCGLFDCGPAFLVVDADLNVNDLGDVTAPSPLNNQILVFNSTTLQWENQNQAGGAGTRTYAGIDPITVDNDNNLLGWNPNTGTDFNGTFDGNNSTFYIDWTNSVNRLFSFLSLDDNSSFDDRYNLTVDTNDTGRIDFPTIANHPVDLDTNAETACSAGEVLFGDGSCGAAGSGTDINSNNGFVVGVTSNAITPDLNFGGAAGYKAANFLCDSNFGESHLCTVDEIIDTIRTEDFSSVIGETGWVAEGAPGFTTEANDCAGYTSKVDTSLGSFWNFIDAEDSGGKASLTACSGERKLVCCR